MNNGEGVKWIVVLILMLVGYVFGMYRSAHRSATNEDLFRFTVCYWVLAWVPVMVLVSIPLIAVVGGICITIGGIGYFIVKVARSFQSGA